MFDKLIQNELSQQKVMAREGDLYKIVRNG